MSKQITVSFLLFAGWMTACASGPQVLETRTPTERWVLPNGLTVLFTEMPSSSQVAVVARVKVGFFDEEDRLAGLSHLLEHMYFKGTAQRPGPEDVARETKGLGGALNARTFYDETVYHVVLPASQLERAIDIHADALLSPLIDPAQLKKEIEVVLHEGQKRMDSTKIYAWEKMKELTFQKHRVRRWLTGSDQGLRKLTRDTILEFHRNYYRPNNVILSIVGGVRRKEVEELVQRYYGQAVSGEVKRSQGPAEPVQEQLRLRHLVGDIRAPQINLTFQTVPRGHADELALDVLSVILGQGRGARLPLELQQHRGWVSNVRAWQSCFSQIGWMEITLDDPKRKTFEETVAVTVAQMQDIQTNGISEAELDRARSWLARNWISFHESPLALADTLAEAEHFGGIQRLTAYPDLLSKITREQVQEVARKYTSLSRLSIQTYAPKDFLGAPLRALDFKKEIETLLTQKNIRERTPFVTTKKPASIQNLLKTFSSSTSPMDRARFPKVKLPSGVEAILVPQSTVPDVTVLFLFRGGRSRETEATSGWTATVTELLSRGAEGSSAEQFAIDLETLGASVSGLNFTDDFGLSLTSLSSNWKTAFDSVQQALQKPAFHPKDVTIAKLKKIAALSSAEDDGFSVASNLFRSVAFVGTPYGLPAQGLRKAIQASTRDQLLKWYQDHTSQLRVVAVGDFDTDEMKEKISQLTLGSASPAVTPALTPIAWGGSGHSVERVRTSRRSQTSFMLGFPGPASAEGAQDLVESQKVDLISSMTGGLGGRFFSRIRGEENLAYAVHAVNWNLPRASAVLVYIGFSPENEARVESLLSEEIEKIKKDGFQPIELQRAKSYLLGQYRQQMESQSGLAYWLFSQWSLGREPIGYERYHSSLDKISVEAVNESFRNVFDQAQSRRGVFRGTPKKKLAPQQTAQ